MNVTSKTDLMSCFLPQRDEIPKHVGILQMCGRISLLCMNKGWKEYRIPDEEDGRIVTDQIPVSFIRIEFDSESTRISCRIGRSGLTAHG